MAAYRDSFRLFLTWANRRLRKPPSSIMLEDIDAPLVSAFFDHLERERGNSARTRNARLAAIHSFFQYAALRSPAESGSVQRVLAIPAKRVERTVIDSLAPSEELPEAPLGIGAVWESVRTVTAGEMTVAVTTSHEVTAIDGTKITLKVTQTQDGKGSGRAT